MNPVIVIVIKLLQLYMYLLFVPILLSWIPHDRNHPIIQMLYMVTDPVLLPCRELMYAVMRAFRIDHRMLPIDFSPIIAFLLIQIIIGFLAKFAYSFG